MVIDTAKIPWKRVGLLLAWWIGFSILFYALKALGIGVERAARLDGMLSATALLWLFPSARPWSE